MKISPLYIRSETSSRDSHKLLRWVRSPPSQRRTNAVINMGEGDKGGNLVISRSVSVFLSLSLFFRQDYFLPFYLLFKQLSQVSCAVSMKRRGWEGGSRARDERGDMSIQCERESRWRSPTSGHVKPFPRESGHHYLRFACTLPPYSPLDMN